MRKVSKSVEDTSGIAKLFADQILLNDKSGAFVVCLSGDLGSGKTSFTKAFAKHLGVKDTIASPTIILMKKYGLKNQKYKFLLHFDAYNLKNENELLNLGWKEIVSNKDNLIIIEWPEIVKGIIPADAHYIYLSHQDGDSRVLELK